MKVVNKTLINSSKKMKMVNQKLTADIFQIWSTLAGCEESTERFSQSERKKYLE